MDSNVCPLLKDPSTYNPDTIDLVSNSKERTYWLTCLEKMVKNFTTKAKYLNPDYPAAYDKAQVCWNLFHNLAEKASENPDVLSPLSIRTLLDFHEANLRDEGFKDAWFSQKEHETQSAFYDFGERLAYLDTIDSPAERWAQVMIGVLAGNVFDWGSYRVAEILDSSADFGLSSAMATIEERPWFKDDLDEWIKRITVKAYSKVVIFVDNAGVDFVLGIVPLVREFLKMETVVVLAANSYPALNDVTAKELHSFIDLAARDCPLFEKTLASGQLLLMANGQKGPCLNLNSLSPELCLAMKSADLVVLEGMGRAVHTNLYAEFNVDSLKVAVIKNEWLAQSLGATKRFPIIFKYEQI